MVEGEPEGLDDDELALDYGGTLKGVYPDDPYDVEMQLRDDREQHIKKGDFVSNPDDYVIVSQEVVDLFAEFNIPDVEYWPFTLINHKGRVHSKNYRFVVPNNPFDAIDEQASEIDRDANNVVIGVDKIVFDKDKVKSAPDMFRVNDLGEMAFSEPLAKKLETEYTNFVFKPVELN